MSRNPFTPTGIAGLDQHIDLQLDRLRSAEAFQDAAGQLQGIRTVLACIDRETHAETLRDLAEAIAARDPQR